MPNETSISREHGERGGEKELEEVEREEVGLMRGRLIGRRRNGRDVCGSLRGGQGVPFKTSVGFRVTCHRTEGEQFQAARLAR